MVGLACVLVLVIGMIATARLDLWLGLGLYERPEWQTYLHEESRTMTAAMT
jgi:hypothetical protein